MARPVLAAVRALGVSPANAADRGVKRRDSPGQSGPHGVFSTTTRIPFCIFLLQPARQCPASTAFNAKQSDCPAPGFEKRSLKMADHRRLGRRSRRIRALTTHKERTTATGRGGRHHLQRPTRIQLWMQHPLPDSSLSRIPLSVFINETASWVWEDDGEPGSPSARQARDAASSRRMQPEAHAASRLGFQQTELGQTELQQHAIPATFNQLPPFNVLLRLVHTVSSADLLCAVLILKDVGCRSCISSPPSTACLGQDIEKSR